MRVYLRPTTMGTYLTEATVLGALLNLFAVIVEWEGAGFRP